MLSKIPISSILILACLGLDIVCAQITKPDTPRFDPVTGLPVKIDSKAPSSQQFDPETGMPLIETPDPILNPRFDPETGLPIRAEPEAACRQRFDPETGELIPLEPAETEVAAIGRPPVFTETALRIMARNNAEKNHYSTAWGLGGGLLGCGGMVLGSIVGAIVAEFPGFIIGATAGGVTTTEVSASTPPTIVPVPEQLKSADPLVRHKYRQFYLAEIRKLRRKSIYSGMVGVAAFSLAGILILSSMTI
ncbi:MAG: hypothetical protein JSU77_01900 [Fidelibacterota bacterium]|nr:MAG: hypothetical protein JSU77_01900 [Candidatus Neomarinimicrobiota bacterium]